MRGFVESFGVGLSLVMFVVACGPSSPGTVISRPPGLPDGPLSVAERWEFAIRAFGDFEREGWSEDACTQSAAAFRFVAVADDASEPQQVQALYMAGMSHQRCFDRQAAMRAYGEALAIEPGHCHARVGLGLAQVADDRAATAEQTFREAIRHDNQCTEGYVNLAVLQRRSGQLDEALTNLRRALAIDSQYVVAFHEMALVHLDRAEADVRELDLAAIVCRQAQQIDEDYAPLYNTWGIVDLQRGRVVDALAKFERAFELDPDFYEARMNFGQITLSFRGYEDAETAFREALRIRPGDYDALIGHGVSLRGLGRIEEARERYVTARRLEPERPEAWFNLGVLHQDYRSGTVEDLATARTLFETFVAKAGSDEEYAAELAEVERCCPARPARRGQAAQCRPGRLQNIGESLHALGEAPVPSCR